MTKVIRWYYAISALTLGFLLVGTGLLFWQYSALALLAPSENVNNILGWAWSGNTGWISLNSENCEKLNEFLPPEDYICDITDGVDYGLRLLVNEDGTGGEIKGYAWSENLGWICFGDGGGDDTAGCTGSPPIGNLAIEFFCRAEVEGVEKTVACDTLGMSITELSGWGNILSLGNQGWIKLSGDIYGARLELDDPDDDNDYTQLAGWMWQNAGGTSISDAYGVGWICLGDDAFCTYSRPEILFPYLRAEGGDIFARSISTFFGPPRGVYNSQFRIEVLNNIGISTRFTSECVSDLCKQSNIVFEIPAPDPTNITDPYNFKLGRFDMHGLTTKFTSNTLGDDLNKYNYVVKIGAPDFNSPLDNKVYNINSDYTVSNSLIINNGLLEGESGAGTIIVNGNLNINNNIIYESGEVTERKQLASIVWIVMGDVHINPNVTKVAGSFIVLGQRKSDMDKVLACIESGSLNYRQFCTREVMQPPQCVGMNNTCGEMPKCLAYNKKGNIYEDCGWFDTGQGSELSDYPLTVYGSVFARQFDLGRTYIDPATRSPAEKFIADGRLQLNPPPGMSDFAKGLPSFQRQ
ncbi:MAG: hypothetical protein WC575_00680 [Patescibacteria group bacterium]